MDEKDQESLIEEKDVSFLPTIYLQLLSLSF